ncbi:hypothetical protein KKC45_01490 [Patescibacteria group bacterium]|nr:hypothetical protein [Patescibacteria group bacterium]
MGNLNSNLGFVDVASYPNVDFQEETNLLLGSFALMFVIVADFSFFFGLTWLILN